MKEFFRGLKKFFLAFLGWLAFLAVIVFLVGLLIFVKNLDLSGLFANWKQGAGIPKPTLQVSATPVSDLSQEPFAYDERIGFYGTLTLTGYLKLEKTDFCFQAGPESDTSLNSCPPVTYAFFEILQTDNPLIYDFLSQYSGNAFVGENSVGLGCYEDKGAEKRIYSVNEADSGEVENNIIGDQLRFLLESTSRTPVRLQLSRAVFTSGAGAPECYSHFRNFTVLPLTDL